MAQATQAAARRTQARVYYIVVVCGVCGNGILDLLPSPFAVVGAVDAVVDQASIHSPICFHFKHKLTLMSASIHNTATRTHTLAHCI